ncbi:MAG: MFS transporter [Candidatus Dasytiphilus stammeri]
MNDTTSSFEFRALLGLAMMLSLRMLGMFMVLPIMTSYGRVLVGSTELLLGIALGIYGITQACFQLPLGLLSDRIGRKPVIIGGLLLLSAGSLISALTSSIWGVIIGRALQGTGAISGVAMALLSDLTPDNHLSQAISFIGIILFITFVLSIIIGPIITHYIGLHGIFLLITILSLCSIFILHFVVPSPPLVKRKYFVATKYFQIIFRNYQLLKINIGIFCLNLLLISNFTAFPLILKNSGLLYSQQWKIYLITLIISGMTIFSMRFYLNINRCLKWVLILCITILLGAEIIFWKTNNKFGIFIGIQLFFLSFNLLQTLLPSLVIKQSSAEYRGTVLGIYSTCQFLGGAIGGCVGGLLLKSILDNKRIFLINIIIALLWLGISLTIREPLCVVEKKSRNRYSWRLK